MDIAIRFFIKNTEQCETRYLPSVFLDGRPTAENLLKHLLKGLQSWNLDGSKMTQISMDGPNVNIKLYRLLKDSLGEASKLIDIGTCGLHVVHGSLQSGHKASGWSVNSFLIGLYYLFKDSPARRSDYLGMFL